MNRARDSATGELVSASDATPRRAYRCPNCRQRVVIRESRLTIRKRHFAHAVGVAPSDCEFYFPPMFRYSGRVGTRVYHAAADRLQHEHLELVVGSQGPFLALCLPPAGETEWTGYLQFSASRVSRRLNWHALQNGQRIEFPLFDGMWALMPEGFIATAYLEAVQLGGQALEAGTNLFYVERSFGRRVMPAESISCGESIRWLSRQSFHIPVELREIVKVDCEYQANGWTLNRLAIPLHISAEQIRILAEWLQRRIVERSARVWIETPFANAYTPQGIPIYPANVALTLRADQPVDLRICAVKTAQIIGEASEVSQFKFTATEEGTIEIVVNDYHYEFLYIGKALTPINALVRFAGADFTDISNAQRSLDAIILTRRDRCHVLISVGHTDLLQLVSTQEVSVEHDDRVLRTEFRPGSILRFDKLGELHWPASVATAEPVSLPGPRSAPMADMVKRARWLRSISTSIRDLRAIRFRLPTALVHDQNFAPLSTLSWSVRWTAHVRQLQRDLECLYP